MPNMTKISITKNGNTQSVTSKNNKLETLNDVSLAFAVWRANKKSIKERIPQELWDAAIKLSTTHSKPTIINSLRVDSTVFYNKCKEHFNKPKKNASCKPAGIAKPWTIRCERPDGLILDLSGTSMIPPAVHQTISNFLQ